MPTAGKRRAKPTAGEKSVEDGKDSKSDTVEESVARSKAETIPKSDTKATTKPKAEPTSTPKPFPVEDRTGGDWEVPDRVGSRKQMRREI